MTRPSDPAPADAPPPPSGKHYVGERTPDGCEVLVLDRDKPDGGHPLALRLDLRVHSPTGFEFGFAGSGPAQLGLALLADALGDDERAMRNYQEFKFREVARWEGDRFAISAEDIRHIVAGLERDRGCGRA